MPRLKTVELWQVKPYLVAMLSQVMARFADDLHEILAFTKSQKYFPGLPEPSPKEWLKLYRSHRYLDKQLSGLRHFGGLPEFLVKLYEAFQDNLKSQRIGKAQPAIPLDAEQQAMVDAALQEVLRLFLADFESEIKNEPLTEKFKETARTYLVTLEFHFLLKVTLPCFVCYRTSPARLLRQARLGNHEALEKLIRLDILVLSDPRIILHAYRLLHHNKYKYEAVIARAMLNAPKPKFSRVKVKYLLAAAISLISEALGARLNTTEIQKIFNKIAQDNSGGEVGLDPDFSEDPETFARKVREERDNLKPILSPDKTF